MKVAVAQQQLSVMSPHSCHLLVLKFVAFLFLCHLLLLSLVAPNSIIVGDLKLLKLGHLFLVEESDCLGDVVEEPKHLTKVLSVDHRREVVYLLVPAEQVEKILDLL